MISRPVSMAPAWRKDSLSSSPSSSPNASTAHGRPMSAIFTSPQSSHTPSHTRNHSLGLPELETLNVGSAGKGALTRASNRGLTSSISSTFAPQFIKSAGPPNHTPAVQGIEGENDFSGKRYVWLKDTQTAFVRGWVVEEGLEGQLIVQCDDGSQREVGPEDVEKVNPAKFDKADDMAELTHLNEPSVVHNLHMRYQADLIYTYSGLFLVAVNPYSPLPIYTNEYIKMYKGRSRDDTKPHIFAMADEAFQNLVQEGENQSILVTGESGAGKTENTKKVIQYLAAVATSETLGAKIGAKPLSNLSQQILRANPILESFGNAQTVRNNNSSRFGKFIRIEFTRSGQIAGAFIDWYLLEKSRVVRINSSERNYHIFYQLLNGAEKSLKDEFFLADKDSSDFCYTEGGNDIVAGISDQDEWQCLMEAFSVMGFSKLEQKATLRAVAAVLHLGNITVMKESLRLDQACLSPQAQQRAEIVCRLLGIPLEPFIKGLLHPRVKAGREWVEKVQTPEQVRLTIDALSKGIYERGFGDLVTRINRQLDRTGVGADDSHFIGVLDIAGFEIFEENSFEQLCINYTNEKLQQFFNHHMFVLEQEEYARERIEWKFIDFGHDLQPTINLIELPNPIGIFSCLDEDSVMPKATDKSFTEKLHSLWDRKSPKYRRSLFTQGFMLTHYAAEVEYSTEGWLEKNKDPMNDNITRLLAGSTDKHIACLFADCAYSDDSQGALRSRVKKGLFRTVAQRHKEQLSNLMNQLNSTHPHFVRCIIPNHKKKPKQFSTPLVLDQLRCNGVLEGIRIARTGFPNRLTFPEFRQRYEVLCKNVPKGYTEGQKAAQTMLQELGLDSSVFRVGLTKVFFRAGVLAELEDQRDSLIAEIMTKFQSLARGFVQRKIASKRFYRSEATRIIRANFQLYLQLRQNPWWNLFVKTKPLLGGTRSSEEVKKRDGIILKLEDKITLEAAERHKIEEEKRRAEMDVHRIQQILESERSLALDKEEIFKRLQLREDELSEKLSGALEDQENLEDQLDELILAKKKVEEQCELRQAQLGQAGTIISKLESEKNELHEKFDLLAARLDETLISNDESTKIHDKLINEMKILKSNLSLKERKIQELEAKLLKSDQGLDTKLSNMSKDLVASRNQLKEQLEENRQLRQKLLEHSSTSARYKDLLHEKERELSSLRSNESNHELEKRRTNDELISLSSKHSSLQRRLHEIVTEMENLKSEKIKLQDDAAEAKILLDAKTAEHHESMHSRRLLDGQIAELKGEISRVQADLNRERQSRDDVLMLGEHTVSNMKRDYDSLNDSKIEIEKELYLQQDNLRRALEARSTVEKERKELQAELRNLRQRFTEIETTRLQENSEKERIVSREISERQATILKDLEAKDLQIEELEIEKARLTEEVQRLTRSITESENFRLTHDQQKERLERELVTMVKGLQLKLADFETKSYSSANQDVRSLHSRIQELEKQIDTQESERNKSQRAVRNVDRTIRDLQAEIDRRDEVNSELEEELSKSRDETERLHQTIEELQSNGSQSQIQAARRLNRELREEKERALRLERELEGWKALRLDRGNLRSGMNLFAAEDDDRDGVASPTGSSENDPDQIMEDNELDVEAENDEEYDEEQDEFQDSPPPSQFHPLGRPNPAAPSPVQSTSSQDSPSGLVPHSAGPTSNPNPTLISTLSSTHAPSDAPLSSNQLRLKVRPEALIASVYDIVPTIAAPHSTSINVITATPDLRWVFSGGSDGYIRKFNWVDTVNGKVMLTVAQRHPFVDSVTKAGVLVSYWENEEPRVRSPSFQPSSENLSLSPVYSLAVQSQGLWLLSGWDSGAINLQSVRHDEGKQIACLRKHKAAVSVLSISPDEKSLLSGSWDKNIYDWDLNTGQTKRAFKGSGGQISAIEARPSSSLPIPVESDEMVSKGDTLTYNSSTRFLTNGDVLTNGSAAGDGLGQRQNGEGVDEAQASPTDSLFNDDNDASSLFGEYNDNTEAGAPSGRQFGDDEDDEFTRAIANGFQQQVDAEEADVTILNMDTSGLEKSPSIEPAGSIEIPTREEDATHLLPNGLPHSDSGMSISSAPVSKSAIDSMDAISSSDATFLAASIDGTLRIWDRRQSNPAACIYPKNAPPWCMNACWSPDGNFIYAGRRNGTVEEYSLHKSLKIPERTFRFPQGSGPVSAVKAMPNGKHLICASFDILRLYDLKEQESLRHSVVPFLIIPGHRGGVISSLYTDPTCRFLISAAGNRGWEGSSTEVLLGYDIGVVV
ncbi:MAG: hypothetical protein M1829_005855 [Trizodia sp. TS-e1964]|nr:MAG: hypothetical protein M1829_005855 [Trizodia sp. TS-e1964]